MDNVNEILEASVACCGNCTYRIYDDLCITHVKNVSLTDLCNKFKAPTPITSCFEVELLDGTKEEINGSLVYEMC